jgi:membrane-bound lytic murein transglycosylase D
MEGRGGMTTTTKAELKNLLLSGDEKTALLTADEIAGSSTFQVSGRYNSTVLVKHISMSPALFSKMNPDFDKQIADNGEYELRLPNDKVQLFQTKKTDILKESIDVLLSR